MYSRQKKRTRNLKLLVSGNKRNNLKKKHAKRPYKMYKIDIGNASYGNAKSTARTIY